MTIAALIDKQDNAELIRDQIAGLLAIETDSQVRLAAAAGKYDPQEWALRIYQERSNPWENLADGGAPVVNVWWDSSSFDMGAGNTVEYQKCSGTYNIDCYGYGVSADNPAGGHTAGDRQAAETAQRAARLVRNILMSDGYTYLALRGTVWRRWCESINIFQPQQDNQNMYQVVGARVVFKVEFNEFAPQYIPQTLEAVAVDVQRTEDGQVVIQATYPSTP